MLKMFLTTYVILQISIFGKSIPEKQNHAKLLKSIPSPNN
jgi:hypothetical protein